MLGILDDVKVIELANGLSGAFAAKLLADQGADTIKIEPPVLGDATRREPPFLGGDPNPEQSSLFLAYNTNKRGITLDIETPTGKDLFRRLAKDADVIIESFQPGYLESLGIDFAELNKVNPKLILVSITPFGQTGPYKHYLSDDLVEQAMGGHLITGGDTDKEPMALPQNQSSVTVGRNAVIATTAALLYQQTSGSGQHIDVCSMEAMVQTPPSHIHQFSFTGVNGGRGGGGGQKQVMDSMHLKTKDRFVTLATAGTRGKDPLDVWGDFLGEPKLKDPKWKSRQTRAQEWEELRDLVESKLMAQGSYEFLEEAMAQFLVVGVVQSPLDVVNCVQLEERSSWSVLDHPEVGRLKYPGGGFITNYGNPVEGGKPAPLLGQHNQEVYCKQLGLSQEELIALKSSGVT